MHFCFLKYLTLLSDVSPVEFLKKTILLNIHQYDEKKVSPPILELDLILKLG